MNTFEFDKAHFKKNLNCKNVQVKEENGEVSLIEINSETDFVAKNKDFIFFCKELLEISFKVKGDIEKINNYIFSTRKWINDLTLYLDTLNYSKLLEEKALKHNNKSSSQFE
mgnify:CR=1 FL=1